jgi:hypothetical protein
MYLRYCVLCLEFSNAAGPQRNVASGIMFIIKSLIFKIGIFIKSYHPIPWRDSISRPLAPVSSVAWQAETLPLHRPRCQGFKIGVTLKQPHMYVGDFALLKYTCRLRLGSYMGTGFK